MNSVFVRLPYSKNVVPTRNIFDYQSYQYEINKFTMRELILRVPETIPLILVWASTPKPHKSALSKNILRNTNHLQHASSNTNY